MLKGNYVDLEECLLYGSVKHSLLFIYHGAFQQIIASFDKDKHVSKTDCSLIP